MSAENSESEVVQASGVAHGGGGSLVVNATLRSTLTIQHLTSADFFATQATDIEDKARADGVKFGDSVYNQNAPRHAAYVTGAIFVAVAYLEAAINDLFALAADPMYKTDEDYKNTIVGALTPETRGRFADAWHGTGSWKGKALRACPQTLHAQKVLFPNQQGHNRWFPGYREDAHTAIVPSRAFGDCARASSARRATAGGRRIASFLATTDLVVDQKVRWKGRGFVDTL